MFSPSPTRSLPLLVLTALVVCLTFGSEGRTQNKSNAQKTAEKVAKQQAKQVQKAQKEHAKQVKQVVTQQRNLEEASALRRAYILMALANHNYDGHRAKAMKAVESAVGILDSHVARKGTGAQKWRTLQEDVTAARAKEGAKRDLPVHELQILSHKQMRDALALLVEVDVALARNNQKAVLGHVNKAVQEVRIALALDLLR